MIAADETFDGTFPFTPHFSTAADFRMHYVDEGAGRPILCLHGQPSWSYLYRDIIRRLSPRYRVIAPDHMGFGKSETPQNRPYLLAEHVENIVKLVVELDLRDITLVVHDWGGMIGGAAAIRLQDRVSRLVVINTAVPTGDPREREASIRNTLEVPYFQWMARLHQTGTLDTVIGEIGAVILSVMKGLQGVERNVDPTWLRAYASAFPTPESARGAIAFPKSIVSGALAIEPVTPEQSSWLRALPAMMIYGLRDRVLLAKHMTPLFEAAFPGAPVHRLENAGHFAQEDAPETIAVLIDEFVARCAVPKT
jgi:haloalkane dehalogenase